MLIFEAAWLALIKKYPSIEKLEETKFNLTLGTFIQIMNYLFSLILIIDTIWKYRLKMLIASLKLQRHYSVMRR